MFSLLDLEKKSHRKQNRSLESHSISGLKNLDLPFPSFFFSGL